MKLSQYKFNLPPELIAQYPATYRDESRLMVVHKDTGKFEHCIFKNVLQYFNENDVFVLNNTRVFPARLYGNKEKTGAQIEVFLLRELNEDQKLWDVVVDPARKIRVGNKLYFGEDDVLVAEVIDNTTSRGRTIRFLFNGSHDEFKKTLYSLGETPLPKHIKRPAEPSDRERYQTIFARHEGAVAAPTAGLHFSPQLLKRMEINGIKTTEITLHMGLGCFRSVDVEDLTKHKMDSERIIIPDEAVRTINDAKANKSQVCAIGTTVLRTLESAVTTTGLVKPFDGWTNKFIFPPYVVQVPTSLITNFHLPYTTFMMMVAAFTGHGLLLSAYEEAIKEKYRFGAYGDAMLII